MAILTGFPPSNTITPGRIVVPKIKVQEKEQKKYKNYWLDRKLEKDKDKEWVTYDLSQMTSAGGRYKEYERLRQQDIKWDSTATPNWDFETALGDTIKEKYEHLYVKLIEVR